MNTNQILALIDEACHQKNNIEASRYSFELYIALCNGSPIPDWDNYDNGSQFYKRWYIAHYAPRGAS